jgi:cell division protein FtsZ
MQIADEGIRALSESVDSLITIPNEKLLTILGKDASLLSAFAKADDVLAGAVRGISDIIKRPGMINVDFADVRTVMSEMGMAMMGTGAASGPNRAREATEAAIRNPLLEDVNLQGARGILVNITAGPDLSLGEYSDVGSIIEAFASDHAMVKVGTVIDPDMRDELHVTVVATGLGAKIEKPVKVIDNTMQTAQAAPVQQHAVRQEQPSVNYRDLDRPTVMRNQAHAGATAAAKMNPQDDLDYLDIPAFLRRQAD